MHPELPLGDLTLKNVTLANGLAKGGAGNGGGSGSYRANGGFFGGSGGGAGLGGAIFNMGASTVPGSGVLFMTNRTIEGNIARGGDGALSGSGSGGAGYGGGIFNLDVAVTLNNSTVVRNVVLGGDHGTGGSFGHVDGGAIYNLAACNVIQTGGAASAHLVLFNNIVANTWSTNVPRATPADLVSRVINLDNTNSASLTGSTNFVGTSIIDGSTKVDPNVIAVSGFIRLGFLQDNGGLTQTISIDPSCPAFGAGNSKVQDLPSTDQRGMPRTANGRLDLGAYQLQESHRERGMDVQQLPSVEPQKAAMLFESDDWVTLHGVTDTDDLPGGNRALSARIVTRRR